MMEKKCKCSKCGDIYYLNIIYDLNRSNMLCEKCWKLWFKYFDKFYKKYPFDKIYNEFMKKNFVGNDWRIA